MTSKAKVRIGSDVFLYQEKEPYQQSGASDHGVLVLNEAEDLVQCHECGQWFNSLPWHIWQAHGMKVRAYKIKHGLPMKAALCGERVRQKLIQGGFAELRKRGSGMAAALVASRFGKPRSESDAEVRRRPYSACRNRKGKCPAQILRDVKVLAARLGRTPKSRELHAAGIFEHDIRYLFGQSVREFMALVGLSTDTNAPRYSTKVLIEALRDFYVVNGRLPAASDHRRGKLATRSTYLKRFGSMEQAYFVAGLENIAEAHFANLGKMYTAEQLEALLRAYIQRTGAFPDYEVWSNGAPGLPSWKTFKRYIPDMVEFRARVQVETGTLQEIITSELLESKMRSYIQRTGAFPKARVWASGAPGLPTRKTFMKYMADLPAFVARLREETKYQNHAEVA